MNRFFSVVALFAVVGCASMGGKKADPRVGLKAGLMDAGEAVAGLQVLNKTPSPAGFLGVTNSDLAFSGQYAIQGNYNGFQIWDMTTPSSPQLVTAYTCPASQNDVSVFRNLLFMSVEWNNSTIDCKRATFDSVSKERFRGIRVFDIADVRNPKLVANVQTCRGSHTHTVVEDPKDRANVYIYVSGSAGMRSPTEMPECVRARPDSNQGSALWRIEIIKVPLANPAAAAITNRADIFSGLKYQASHGAAEADIRNAQRMADSLRPLGGFVAVNPATKSEYVVNNFLVRPLLDSVARARGASSPSAQDSAWLRSNLQSIVDRNFALAQANAPKSGVSDISTNRQCHDITVYPGIGLAGGACEGHGILLDISDVTAPRRIGEVADSNFAYWHSATFSNDGKKILFTDEWGGGGGPRCRATDKKEWGANAIFEIVNNKMEFRSYYKLPAVQTDKENCVAHNGSLIPIPDRDIMVQSWYQGGVSVFDWTDPRNPVEIAYFDRGPVDSLRQGNGGTWSAYWYNGTIVSSEIARGIDMMAMTPTQYVTKNEIDAANTVKMSFFNAQGQPKWTWPASFPLARAYVDQLERKKCLPKSRISKVRADLAAAEAEQGAARTSALRTLAASLNGDKAGSCDEPKVTKLQAVMNDMAMPIVP
jgi:hypothetical protein